MKRSNNDEALLGRLIHEQKEELEKESVIVYYRNNKGYVGKGTQLTKKWNVGIKA